MNGFFRLTSCATLLGLFACVAVNINAPSLTIPDGAVDMAWSQAGALRLAHAFYSGFDQPTRALVDDQAAWTAAWAKVTAGSSPVAPLPAVDFNRYSVLVAALGRRNSGGYDIQVTRLANADNKLYVEITSTSPGARCGTATVLTQPVDIVRVAKPHAPLVYVERALVHDC